jgi:hypothetical protein
MKARLIGLFKAVGAFFTTLFSPPTTVASYSKSGQAILNGWPNSPEERLIEFARDINKASNQPVRLGMYCFSGAHEGEVLTFRKPQEELGVDVFSTQVLTPSDRENKFRFRLLLNGSITLTSEPGSVFKVNQMETLESKLFDYDEIEIAGNRCLVLDLSEGGRV